MDKFCSKCEYPILTIKEQEDALEAYHAERDAGWPSPPPTWCECCPICGDEWCESMAHFHLVLMASVEEEFAR